MSGPCSNWATEAEVAACASDVTFACDLTEIAAAVSELLYEWSGRKFAGECGPFTIRPCTPCRCTNLCRCEPPQLDLGPFVREVSEVKVDGVVLDEEQYRLDEGRWLVRLTVDNANEGWPICNDLARAGTEEGTLEVTLTRGLDPPLSGRRAAAVYAAEWGLSCTPGQEDRCRLPSRTTSYTRQGVTVALMDPTALLKDGRTGIPEVDAFLSAFSRDAIPRIWGPEDIRRRVVG